MSFIDRITLNDCLEKAKQRGCKNEKILVVSGDNLYKYDKNKWYKVGSMVGFA